MLRHDKGSSGKPHSDPSDKCVMDILVVDIPPRF